MRALGEQGVLLVLLQLLEGDVLGLLGGGRGGRGGRIARTVSVPVIFHFVGVLAKAAERKIARNIILVDSNGVGLLLLDVASACRCRFLPDR